MVNIKKLEDTLWKSADSLRANSGLRLNQFSEPVLGLIFLKFADVKFDKIHKEIITERSGQVKGRERELRPEHYHAKGVIYLPETARYEYLLTRPEEFDFGKELNTAMKSIEANNPALKGILPKVYTSLENSMIIELLKNFNSIPENIEGDSFGGIYEYFLGKFSLGEGQRGGEFFTPTSIVKLIVNIIEPYHGRVYDPACGSGGMFVQSLKFIKKHTEKNGTASKQISVYGQEKTAQTVKIAKINLAINGLGGEIKEGNSIYQDLHEKIGEFDYVMANPPFNLKGIDMSKVKDDPRYPYGTPSTDNGNYLWVQIFLTALNEKGRAGFVMANSASDARHSEMEIRKQIIENNEVDVMIAVGPNMFYNVTLPCTLWFFDKDKKNTDRKDKILFIDAKDIYRQVDRAHREFTDEQILKITEIVRAYRQEDEEKEYKDIPGLCKVATLDEVREQGYSLNPGRYVGVVKAEEEEDGVFEERLTKLTEEFEELTQEAHELEEGVLYNVKQLLDR